ncbi:MAG: VWA domain-containing protein [Pyrinomonadaceae bacterium]|nr:VWA domain-containing protein [Blastocatellia bacterium]MDQ3221083.1 VWA domain-containing protein [Acidobacteriota bacterium]MDQ3490915.1 VWA domain-containing protein [Acidobacteriota bacterium]
MFGPKAFLLTIFVYFGFTSLQAQDDPIRVDSAIVRVNIGVVDGRGRPITSLDKEKFSLFEDGVKQDISKFETTTAPFSVVMLLDMSGSTRSFRQNIQLSASRFLDALAPDDRVAVVEFYSKVNLLNDFTTNRRTAAHSISVANGGGDTDLYKALQFSLQKLSKEGSRRKAIVVLSDGIDTDLQNDDRKRLAGLSDAQIPAAINPESSETLNRILNRADVEGVTIYPLALPTGDPARLADPTPRQIAMFKAARSRLQIIADRTGGTLNTINRLEQMGTLYALVAADLRTLYTVEYQPTNDKRDGKWRAIKIEVSNPELITRSRQGYFAR